MDGKPYSTNDSAKARKLDWVVQCFTSLPTQYRLYGRRVLQVNSKDPTNSIKVLKEDLQRTKQTTKTTKYTNGHTIIDTKGYTQNKHNKSPSLH